MSAISKRHARDKTAGHEKLHSSKGRSGSKSVSNKQSNHSSATKRQQVDSHAVLNGDSSRLSSANSGYDKSYAIDKRVMDEENGYDGEPENYNNDEEDDYSYDYDEDFEDDFESETENSYADTYNDDYDDEETNYEDTTMSYNRSSSHAEKRMNLEMQEVKQSIQEENKHKTGSTSHKHNKEVERHGSGNKKVSFDAMNRSFINFSAAKERQSSKILAGKARKRGDELLTMIRLDVVSYELLDLAPVPYETFMKTFGTGNTFQTSSQTGDSLDEETQTEIIETKDKEIQYPPSLSMATMTSNNGSTLEKPSEISFSTTTSSGFAGSGSMRLSLFLKRAAHTMITLVEEDSKRDDNENEGKDENQKGNLLPFSERVISLDCNIYPYLQGRPVTRIEFAPYQPDVFVSCHGYSTSVEERNANHDVNEEEYCFLCVWNVNYPSIVQKVMVTENDISACCFSPNKATLVFAGLYDGTICVWDHREDLSDHREVFVRSQFEKYNIEQTFLSPTFITHIQDEQNEMDHMSKVMCLRPLENRDNSNQELQSSTSNEKTSSSSNNLYQLASIEENGCLIIWTVLDGQENVEFHTGLAHWGSVRLVRSLRLELNEYFLNDPMAQVAAHCLANDSFSLFIGSDNGLVYNVPIRQGQRSSPKTYLAEIDNTSACRSIDFCPFGKDFILVGMDDGCVRLHNIQSERPLITWQGTIDELPIKKIIWSPSRPCVFVILDVKSRIHLWDLGSGDIYPAHTVELKSGTNDFSMNSQSDHYQEQQRQILALASDEGIINIHMLSPEYLSGDEVSCKKELARFLHYVSII